MPTYEYQCDQCQQVHEVFQSMTAEPIKKCLDEGCRGKVKRLMGTGAGFLFKGSGFYITDNRSKNYTDGKKKAEDSVKADKTKDKPVSTTESKKNNDK